MPNVKKAVILRELQTINQFAAEATNKPELQISVDLLTEEILKLLEKVEANGVRVDWNQLIDNAHQKTTGLFYEMTLAYLGKSDVETNKDELFAMQLMFDDLNSRK